MPFDYDDSSTRRPQPGTVAATGQILADLSRTQRQQERQMIDQRPSTVDRSSTGLHVVDSHGPGSDTEHTFEAALIGSGLWACTVYAQASSDAVGSSALFVSISGQPEFGPFLAVDGTASPAPINTYVPSSGLASLDVALRLEATGSPTVTFAIEAFAFRLATA